MMKPSPAGRLRYGRNSRGHPPIRMAACFSKNLLPFAERYRLREYSRGAAARE
jgi:hypothetical protein